METYKFKLRIADDGMLKIEFQVGMKDLDVEVLVVVQPQATAPPETPESSMERTRRKYARAYEAWTADEEGNLIALRATGMPIDEIARRLQRQPSAVESRLNKIDERTK